jgi:hypothetical protein
VLLRDILRLGTATSLLRFHCRLGCR